MSEKYQDFYNPDDFYNPFSISQLQDKYPYLQWLEYLNGVLDSNEKLSKDEIINVEVPSFFEGLGNILNCTSKRTQANYIMSRIVIASTDEMGEKLQDIVKILNPILTGSEHDEEESKEERWKKCVHDVKRSLPLAVNALYVRNFFDDTVKSRPTIMFQNMQMSLKKILKNVKLMH